MAGFATMDLKGKKRTSGKKEQKSISELGASLSSKDVMSDDYEGCK